MATPGVLYDTFEALLGVPSRTTQDHVRRLRADPHLMRPSGQGFGALPLNTSEAANALISIATAMANTRRSADAPDRVRLVRGSALVDARRTAQTVNERCDFPYSLTGLGVDTATTFGDAIDSLINDMRTGVYQQWATARGPEGFANIFLKFFNGGRRVVLAIERTASGVKESVRLVFRNNDHDGDLESKLMTVVTEVDGHVLARIAEALGPPT